MKSFLYLATFASAIASAILIGATIAGMIPAISGAIAIGICIFAMYSCVNILENEI